MLSAHDQTLAIIEVIINTLVFILAVALLIIRGFKQWHSIATPILTLSAYRVAINILHLVEREVENPQRLPSVIREMVPGNLLLMCMASVVQTVLEKRGQMPDFYTLAVLRIALLVTALCAGLQIWRHETSADPGKWRLLDIAMAISAGCTVANIWLAARTRTVVKQGLATGERPTVTVTQVALATVGLISAPAVATKMASLVAMRTVECEMMGSAELGFYVDVYIEAWTLLMYLVAALFPGLIARACRMGDGCEVVRYVVVEKELIELEDGGESKEETSGLNEKE